MDFEWIILSKIINLRKKKHHIASLIFRTYIIMHAYVGYSITCRKKRTRKAKY